VEKTVRKRWWAIARLLISLGLLTFVLLTIGLERIGHSLLQADLAPLLIAFALFFVGVVIRAIRWRALLVALDLHVPLRRLVHLYFVGIFFNAFLPTGFGGDVVRILELSQDAQGAQPAKPPRGAEAFGTVVLDRLSGLMVLFAMALLALPFSSELLPPGIRLTLGALAAAGLVAGGLVLQGRWLRRLGGWLPGPLSLTGGGPLARAYDAVTACGWQAVGKALFISFIFNSLLVLEHYLAGRAVSMRLNLTYFAIFVPVFSLTLTVPISLGGLGVREGMAVLLFTQVGVDEATAVAFSLAVYAIARITGLFGGLLYLSQSIGGLRQETKNGTSASREDEAK
jgi:uncharacterized membrane protein YbhN (UPF0104 family)